MWITWLEYLIHYDENGFDNVDNEQVQALYQEPKQITRYKTSPFTKKDFSEKRLKIVLTQGAGSPHKATNVGPRAMHGPLGPWISPPLSMAPTDD